MSEKIDFHSFALRLPKALFKIIEDIAWENRTSLNIQIIDLLIYALMKATDMEEFFREPKNDFEKLPESYRKIFQAFDGIAKNMDESDKARTEVEMSAHSTFITVFMEYAEWRLKK